MLPYSGVTIIYNPHSTGPGKDLADELAKQLQQAMPRLPVVVTPTSYAGHAEQLAYEAALAGQRPLVISSSGDGGYHEVVNGLMRAQQQGARPVAGLLPAGNANDHYQQVHQRDIVDQILHKQAQQIDLLKLSGTRDGQPLTRYAHSYIGLGLSPQGAHGLNKATVNFAREALIVCKTLLRLRPVRIIVNHRVVTYDSLIFSNIGTMSKLLTLSTNAAVDDGKFEVSAFVTSSRFRLLLSLLHAATIGGQEDQQTATFSFQTLRPTRLQLDGELLRLDANSTATITAEPRALRCII